MTTSVVMLGVFRGLRVSVARRFRGVSGARGWKDTRCSKFKASVMVISGDIRLRRKFQFQITFEPHA
jgi:hypothetical protein